MRRDSNAPDDSFTFQFDGKTIPAQNGDSIAAALLANGMNITRSTRQGSPRGPYCMMGACYDCLVEIDGVTLQACMVTACPNMEVSKAACHDQPL